MTSAFDIRTYTLDFSLFSATIVGSEAKHPKGPSPLWSPTNVPAEDPYFDVQSPLLSVGTAFPDEAAPN